MNRPVSILCAARKSVYHSIHDIEVYDSIRDARTFQGGTPIVAHPPCRAWSAFCRHQAKPEPGEKELGLWCCEQLKQCGGVLEQPAHSHMFRAAGLPHPCEGAPDLFTLEVWQAWWGFSTRKATWLCFSGVDRSLICCPLRLYARGSDGQKMANKSMRKRAATTLEFANWLIDLARQSTILPRSCVPSTRVLS